MKKEEKLKKQQKQELPKQPEFQYSSITCHCWKKINAYANTPTPRIGFSATIYKHNIFVFGGTCTYQTFNDLYKFSLISFSWEKVNAQGEIPNPRSGHSAAIVNISGIPYLIIFGGKDSENIEQSSTFSFNIDGDKWSFVPTKYAPPPTAYHSCLSWNNTLILFGGTCLSSDVFIYKPEEKIWKKIQCTGTSPSPRFGHIAVLYEDEMIIHGGINKSSILSDLYSFNIKTHQWTQLEISAEIPRCFHSGVVYKDSLIFYGGKEGENECDDVYEFNLLTWEFSNLKTSGICPERQSQHATVLYKNSLILCGVDSSLHQLSFQPFHSTVNLSQLFDFRIHCDVIINVQNSAIKAHKFIISQSKLLQRLIRSAMEKRKDNREFIIEITLLGIDLNVFHQVLEFMYSGYTEFSSWGSFIKLMIAAQQLECESLLNFCYGQSYDYLRVNNVLKILEKSHDFDLHVLKEICLHFIYVNQEEVMKLKIQRLPRELLEELLKINNYNTMPIVAIYKSIGESDISEHIRTLYRSGEFTDTILVSRDSKKVKAHKSILCAFSRYFQSFMNSLEEQDSVANFEMEDLKKKPVRAYKVDTSYIAIFETDAFPQQLFLNEIDGQYLEWIVEFIYTRNVASLPDDVNVLLKIIQHALTFQLPSLKKLCILKIAKLITPQNAFTILEFCNHFSIQGGLRRLCWQVIRGASKDDLIHVILEKQLAHSFEISRLQNTVKELNLQLQEQLQLNKQFQQQFQQLQRSVKKVEFKL